MKDIPGFPEKELPEKKAQAWGLAITKELVDAHAGTINVESTTGEGSTFQILLPCIETPSIIEKSQTYEERMKKPVEEKLSINPIHKKVLLVEDVQINIKLARMILQNLGMKVTVAENGLDAVSLYRQALKSEPFSVILMDLQMPVMNGDEATQKIREIEKLHNTITKKSLKVPILAMTAHKNDREIEKCISAGMDDILKKPVNIEDIKQTLERYLA